ncbi:hypothetical protein ACF8E6_02665 [Pseudomonas sp. xss_1]|uniref:hypothetical protein n=1 Tax=Pseudomonas sp. xss_1 TaxID=3367214 RepID=UPI00370BE3AA
MLTGFMGFFRKYSIWFGVVAVVVAATALVNIIYPQMSVDTAWVCVRDKCDEKVFLIHGEVKGPSVSWVWLRLEQKLSKNPDVKTVCIASQGGVSADAMEIADNINAHGFDTCLASKYVIDNDSRDVVDGVCQSACIWMVLAGKERILYDDKLEMGFHAARNIFGERADDDLDLFNDKVQFFTRHRKMAGVEYWRLAGLTWWAFHQGATSKTTDCTAHEVQSKYPYFTDIRSWSGYLPDTCGLLRPEDVKRSFKRIP